MSFRLVADLGPDEMRGAEHSYTLLDKEKNRLIFSCFGTKICKTDCCLFLQYFSSNTPSICFISNRYNALECQLHILIFFFFFLANFPLMNHIVVRGSMFELSNLLTGTSNVMNSSDWIRPLKKRKKQQSLPESLRVSCRS